MINRLPALLLLLVCLCVSRGEGMHIFPFAEHEADASLFARVLNVKASTYSFTIFPQDGFHGKLVFKDPRTSGQAPECNAFGIIENRVTDHLIVEVSFGDHSLRPSKSLLTSSSDRSPPTRIDARR